MNILGAQRCSLSGIQFLLHGAAYNDSAALRVSKTTCELLQKLDFDFTLGGALKEHILELLRSIHGPDGFYKKNNKYQLHVSIFFLIEKIGCMYFLSFYDQ